MKRIMALILALMMALALCACGSEQNKPQKSDEVKSDEVKSDDTQKAPPTKEELLAEAQPTTINTIMIEYNNNPARAKAMYSDKAYTVWGIVAEIGADYVDLRTSYGFGSDCIRAYLPNDELIELDTEDVIQVVGVASDAQDESIAVNEYTFNYIVVPLNNAHVAADVYEIRNADIRNISYDRSTYKYTCQVKDENFGSIYLKSGNVTNEQWTHCEKYTLSATGKLHMEVVYGFSSSVVMDSSDETLTQK